MLGFIIVMMKNVKATFAQSGDLLKRFQPAEKSGEMKLKKDRI